MSKMKTNKEHTKATKKYDLSQIQIEQEIKHLSNYK